MKTEREIKAEIARLTKWRKRTQAVNAQLMTLAMEAALSWVLHDGSLAPTKYIEFSALVEKEGRKAKP